MRKHTPVTEGLSTQLAELTLSVAHGPLAGMEVEAARRLVQHAFGVAAASSALPVSAIARAAAGSAQGPCLMFGSAASHLAQDAAFANGATGHASLLEDSGPGGLACGSHPATYVFPSALAAAQERNAAGMDLLRAICAAYETVDRLGMLMTGEAAQRGFRAVSMLGPFGAVAAAGVLYGLSKAQLAAAYGIASNLAGGVNQGFLDGTMEPYLHPAFCARNGLMAARLAQAGCTASPYSLEGERGFFAAFAGRLPKMTGLGFYEGLPAPTCDEHESTPSDPDGVGKTSLAVCRVGAKKFATCLYNQGTLALVARSFPRGFSASEVAQVKLSRPASGMHGLFAPGVAQMPARGNALQLQMSARFTAAAALLGRPVESAAWFEGAMHDAEVDALAQAMELATHASDGIRIDVTLRNGRVETAQSGTETVLVFSSECITAAFMQRVHPVLGERTGEAEKLLTDLPRLASLDRLVSLFKIDSAMQSLSRSQPKTRISE